MPKGRPTCCCKCGSQPRRLGVGGDKQRLQQRRTVSVHKQYKAVRRVEAEHAARADDTSMTRRYYVLLSLGPLPKPDHRPTAEPPPPAEGETSRAFSSGRWSSPSRRSSSSRSRRTMQRTSLMSGHMCATTTTLWCICEDGDGDLSSRRQARRSACVEAGGHLSKGVLGLNVAIQRVLVGEDRRR